MKVAITVGTYKMPAFIELGLASLRRIFGADAPILLSDGQHDDCHRIQALAERYGASYYQPDGADKGHFVGCCQAAVAAVTFAKENGCDLALKINQRFILVSPAINQILDQVFGNDFIDIALPGRPDPRNLLTSRFFASFPFLVDCIFMRPDKISPEFIKDQYEQQWRTRRDKVSTYTEVLWCNLLATHYRSRHAVLYCLTDHRPGWPCFFLRKVQNQPSDYQSLAYELGLKHMRASDFPIQEWAQIKRQQYDPFPKA